MKSFFKIFLFILAMIIIVGEVKSSTVAEKLIHLAADDASIGDIEDALSSKNFEYQKDASVEGGFRVDTEKQYKGWAATQIFSPEIVGEILFMSLGTGSSAERVTEKTVSKTTTVAAQTAKTGTTALTKFYPANNGFLGATERTFLMPGNQISRYGSTTGKFFSPAGTPLSMRALPPGANTNIFNTYKVLKPFEVQVGTISPAFGQPGLGIQYLSPVSADILLKWKIIGF